MLSLKNGGAAHDGHKDKKPLLELMCPRVREIFQRLEPVLDLLRYQEEAATKERSLATANRTFVENSSLLSKAKKDLKTIPEAAPAPAPAAAAPAAAAGGDGEEEDETAAAVAELDLQLRAMQEWRRNNAEGEVRRYKKKSEDAEKRATKASQALAAANKEVAKIAKRKYVKLAMEWLDVPLEGEEPAPEADAAVAAAAVAAAATPTSKPATAAASSKPASASKPAAKKAASSPKPSGGKTEQNKEKGKTKTKTKTKAAAAATTTKKKKNSSSSSSGGGGPSKKKARHSSTAASSSSSAAAAAATAAAAAAAASPASPLVSLFVGPDSNGDIAGVVLEYLTTKGAMARLGATSHGLRAAVVETTSTLHLSAYTFKTPFVPLGDFPRLRHLFYHNGHGTNVPPMDAALTARLHSIGLPTGFPAETFAALEWPALTHLSLTNTCTFLKRLQQLGTSLPSLQSLGVYSVDPETAAALLPLLDQGAFPSLQGLVHKASALQPVIFTGCPDGKPVTGRYWEILRRCAPGIDSIALYTGHDYDGNGTKKIRGFSNIVADGTLAHLKELEIHRYQSSTEGMAAILTALGAGGTARCLEALTIEILEGGGGWGGVLFAQPLDGFAMALGSLPALRSLKLNALVEPSCLRSLLFAPGSRLCILNVPKASTGAALLSILTNDGFNPAWLPSVRQLTFKVASADWSPAIPAQTVAAAQRLPNLRVLGPSLPQLDGLMVHLLNAREAGSLRRLKLVDTLIYSCSRNNQHSEPDISHGAMLLLVGWFRDAYRVKEADEEEDEEEQEGEEEQEEEQQQPVGAAVVPDASPAKGLKMKLPFKGLKPVFAEFVRKYMPKQALA